MSQLKLWIRRGVQHPGRSAFLLLSLSISLAASVAAISLNSAVSWRALPFVDADSLVKLELRNSEGQSRWWSWLRTIVSQLEVVQPASIGYLALGTTGVAFYAAAAAVTALMRALRANECVLIQ